MSKISSSSEQACYFGTKPVEGKEVSFGILPEDRRRHMYLLGKTGMGKSTTMQNMALQDIFAGRGVCFVDPHGDSVEYILDRIPNHRHQDLIYFNPSDLNFPIGLNLLECQNGEPDFLVANGMMAVFKRIWAGVWSSRMEYILNNTLLALLEEKDSTLLGVMKMFVDDLYREKIVKKLKNPMVKSFWQKEFTTFHDRYRQEAIAPIQNKIGQFFSTDLIRNILGQTTSSFNCREIMDGRKILLVNLSKGKLGYDNSSLLGSLLITQLHLATMSRVDLLEKDRADFYLYVDEFQSFATESFSEILSEGRKYGLNLILAHQYIGQLTETGNENIRSAIFGNIGNLLLFQVGARDAREVISEFVPLQIQDLVNLGRTEIAVKMSQNHKNTEAFMAKTLPPIFERLGGGKKEILVDLSREKYGRSRKEVEQKINHYLIDEGAFPSSSGFEGKKLHKGKKRR